MTVLTSHLELLDCHTFKKKLEGETNTHAHQQVHVATAIDLSEREHLLSNIIVSLVKISLFYIISDQCCLMRIHCVYVVAINLVNH